MKLLRRIYYWLRPGQRRLVRRWFFLPADLFDLLLNRQTPLVPPKGRIFTGQGDFVETGNTFLKNFIDTCSLQPHHHILDVGCGIGRVARPLAGFLDHRGRYEGFDIVQEGIDWCKKHYMDYPNFSFRYLPLQNDLYNLNSNVQADAFRFPYPDQDFDLVILTSVFTHMQAEEVKNYLGEIARVLKPGGHCFATFFLITQVSESYLDQSTDPFFPYRYDDFFLHDDHVKNANIAYRYPFIKKMIEQSSLSVKELYEGWWAGKGREACMNFQDVLIMSR